jgi:hypothetical protein
LVLGLALVLTVLTGGIALSLSDLLSALRAEGSWLFWLRLPCLAIPLLVLGYVTGFLDWMFAAALAGGTGQVRWPGRDIRFALKSGTRWLICFLAGPVVPASASVLYWIQIGDLVFWDWLILAELTILALSSWFLLLVAVNQRDRLRDLNPVRVLALIRRLGHRLVAWAVFAAVVGLAHGWLASVALEKLHHDFALGGSLLVLSCSSGLFLATFLFRWVGVWFYWDCLRGKHGRDGS